ncbi:AAA family ATPase [Fusobacterium sp. PH5-44]|uniref:AAA family ATPase n=1 Tax=unclassified Fusobacterium TaxID=2648384 RepID=UPI003D192FCE
MKINYLKYKNNISKWELKKINFHILSLIVGKSGVGKSKVLNCIMQLVNIINGGLGLSGDEWELGFEISGTKYIWCGRIDIATGISLDRVPSPLFLASNISLDTRSTITQAPVFLSESLKKNNEVILERKNDEIIYGGQHYPRLDPSKSILNLIKDNNMMEILKNFNKIFNISDKEEKHILVNYNEKTEQTFFPIEIIKGLNQPIVSKMYLTYKHNPEYFHKIEKSFQNVFPNVESISFREIIDISQNNSIPIPMGQVIPLQLKEYKSQWITQDNISLGMFKILIFIATFYLVPDNSIIIIDEFENSLGVNCIDFLKEFVNEVYNRNIQILLTSHHPYIINSIDTNNWIILHRNKNIVRGYTAKKAGIYESSHENFTLLMNSDKFI